jgi:hypothetical protein
MMDSSIAEQATTITKVTTMAPNTFQTPEPMALSLKTTELPSAAVPTPTQVGPLRSTSQANSKARANQIRKGCRIYISVRGSESAKAINKNKKMVFICLMI